MKITETTPKSDDFYMPAEYSEHDGTLMIFPDLLSSGPFDLV